MGGRASLFWLHPSPPPFCLWFPPVPLYPMGRDRAPFFFGNVFDSGLACALSPKIFKMESWGMWCIPHQLHKPVTGYALARFRVFSTVWRGGLPGWKGSALGLELRISSHACAVRDTKHDYILLELMKLPVVRDTIDWVNAGWVRPDAGCYGLDCFSLIAEIILASDLASSEEKV